MPATTPGLHHVTAIASDGRQNLAFYRDLLGLRLVKKTVNFDVPDTYHLYYGDESGSPGTALTFFLWPNLPAARPGHGVTSLTRFAAPAGTLEAWETYLRDSGVGVSRETRFGEEILLFSDPDGMSLAIVERGDASDSRSLLGFDGVELRVRSAAATREVLVALGFTSEQSEGDRERFLSGSNVLLGRRIDLWETPEASGSRQGLGAVHHIAFRARDDAHQVKFLEKTAQLGLRPSPVMDRNYFHSIYFREPGGILFEVATDTPGFTVDEPLETLGQALKLPPQYESSRASIEAKLPPL